MRRVGVVEGAIGRPEQLGAIAALLPHVGFESVGPVWPDTANSMDLLIAPVDGAAPDDVEAAVRRLKRRGQSGGVVIVLRNPDIAIARRLAREGAADVLPAPVSEAAVLLCLERALAERPETGGRDTSGETVAILKAGGGVGATSLAVQMACLLAGRAAGAVCVADLDLQFGAVAHYLDLPDAFTLTDCLSAGAALEETPFHSALAAHRSGLRVLAAPRDLTPLEYISAGQVETLIRGLRRDFALTILDLPSVWTAWTNRAVELSDRIVLVTQLSVAHIQLVKRQLRVLAAQRLDDRPLTLVCNGLSREQLASVSLKAAERALGRPFDAIIPEDGRTMTAAINEGVEIAAVRRGAKLEKGVADLAALVAPARFAQADARRRR